MTSTAGRLSRRTTLAGMAATPALGAVPAAAQIPTPAAKAFKGEIIVAKDLMVV
ncbi:MAG TPA: hypothetical protein VL048_00585 [Xanthobacteraceae bacterium]|nr:hypothetical protein [Xanthobacteraceae bacterium]